MENYILCIYPLSLIAALCIGAKLSPKKEFIRDYWSVNDSKNLQIVASYSIILHHLTQLITKYGEVYKGPITIMCDMGILFTSIFFFYSGYGLMQSFKTKENYLDGFLYKRLSVVAVPFLLTNILYLLPGLAWGRITNLSGMLTCVFGFTLINTNAWFIIEILLFYVVFYFAFKYIKNKKIALGLLIDFVFLIIFTGFLLRHDTTSLNGHWFRGEWWYNSTILFAVGLIWGENKEKIANVLQKCYRIALPFNIIAFALAFVLEHYVRNKYGYYLETYTYMAYPEKAVTLLSQMLLCILFMTLILLITMKVRFDNIILRKAGAFSLELYLIHDLCMMNYSYEDTMPRFIMYGTTLITATAAAVFLHFVLGKIIGILNDYVRGELETAETVEGTLHKKRIKKYVQRVLGIYIILFACTIGCSAFNLYKKTVVASRELDNKLNVLKNANVGDTVFYGHFDTDYKKDGAEDMEWIVISVKEDRMLLLSKYALFGYYYNQMHEIVSYADSDIRNLLINEGYFEIFSKDEQQYIIADDSTNDFVFLLSSEELNNLELPAKIRIASPTETGKRQGINVDGQDGHSWWWLRSESAVLHAPIVTSEGSISINEKEVNRPTGGVRPAIWIASDKIN